ncbi:MAG: ankyrin repeat domain-containing protein [Candidatus Babeliales bacterium]
MLYKKVVFYTTISLIAQHPFAVSAMDSHSEKEIASRNAATLFSLYLNLNQPRAASSSITRSQSDLKLINAAKLNDLGEVLRSLQLHATMNPQGADTTALIEACKHKDNNEDLVAFLLLNGADPNLVDAQGRAPLHFAALSNHTTVLDKLKKAGAKLDAQDAEGNTPCHVASRNQVINAYYWLSESGANLNVRNRRGLTPLHEAVLGTCICSYAGLPKCGASLAVTSHASELPQAPLPAGSTVFHASVTIPIFNKTMQRSFIAQSLFPDDLAQIITGLLKSPNKEMAKIGQSALQERAANLQEILRKQDANGHTAYMKETSYNANNVPSPDTFLDPAAYELHFEPFVAALRTNTMHTLPQNNVFKVAYEHALPKPEEKKTLGAAVVSAVSDNCVIC